jgi:protein-S-isoprenylcysteine O-methyltransferase Ste14
MKVEGGLFIGCAVFFAGMDIIYWYFSRETTGTVALAFAVGLAFLAGFYVLLTGRRVGQQPQDDLEAEVEDGTGEMGFFSPHSWWPLLVGVSCALAALGAAIGWWLFLIGMLAVMFTTIGFVFEYYRGEFAH